MLSGLQLTWRSVGKIVAVVAIVLTIRVFALAIFEERSQQSPGQPEQRVADMAGSSSATLYIDDLPGNLARISDLAPLTARVYTLTRRSATISPPERGGG